MAINVANIKIPESVIVGKEPPKANPGIMRSAPPMASPYPVPTKISTRRLTLRISSPAIAVHMVLMIIMPSPSNVNFPLSVPPILSVRIPANPIRQPISFLVVSLSLLNTIHANSTRIKVPKELRIAARAPALFDSPI